MRGAIFVGIPGSGKTTTIRNLSTLILKESHDCFLTIPQAYNTIQFESLRNERGLLSQAFTNWMEDTCKFFEAVSSTFHGTGLAIHRTNSQVEMWIVSEGYCFDTLLYFPEITRTTSLPFERRLHDLGFKCVFLTVNQDAILDRCVHSTRAVRGAKWSAYLSKLGSNDDEVVSSLLRRQECLNSLLCGSPLETLVINVQIDSTAESLAQIILYSLFKLSQVQPR